MLPELSDFIFGVVTPGAFALSSIALIVASFARGWIISRFVAEQIVKSANDRAEDWKKLYEIEKQRGDVLQEINVKLAAVGETAGRILEALPTPGGTTKKVT